MNHHASALALALWMTLLPAAALAGVIPLATPGGGPLGTEAHGAFAMAAAISCTFRNAQTLAFGNYNPLSGTSSTSTASFTVTCTRYNTVTLTFSMGQSGTYSQRSMSDTGGDILTYNIYGDPAHTEVIGNGLNGTYYYQGTVGPQGGIGTYYGLAAAGQNVGAGSYSDTIVITMTF